MDPLSIVQGGVEWKEREIMLANSVIAREAKLTPADATAMVAYEDANWRGKLLAFLALFPVLIQRFGSVDTGIGPTLTVRNIHFHQRFGGHCLLLESDLPLIIGAYDDAIGLVRFVLCSPEMTILERSGIYLMICTPVPPRTCPNCE